MVLKRQFQCPTKVVAGYSFDEALGNILGNLSWVLVTSKIWIERDIAQRVSARCSPPQKIVGNVKPNPILSDLIQLAKQLPPVEFIVALGGGSVLDTAKGISALNGMENGEELLLAHLKQGKTLPETMDAIPIIAIPTTSGTGSEVTPWGTIWGDDGIKFSVNDQKLYPAYAVLDPELSLSMPHELTLTTALDALSHAMESVWNRRHTAISDALATQAILIIRSTLQTVLDYPENRFERECMQNAALLAGLAMGTTQTALAHSISYPFTSRFGVPHGLACSFSLAEIARYNSETDPLRMLPIADGLNCNIDEIPDVIDDWFSKLALGSILSSYISPGIVESLEDSSITRSRAANNIRDVNGAVARQIARTALERLFPRNLRKIGSVKNTREKTRKRLVCY